MSALMSMFSAAVSLAAWSVVLLPEVISILPCEVIPDWRLVNVSMILSPPFFLLPQCSSVRLWRVRVPMLTSSPAAIVKLPSAVEPSERMFLEVLILAARLVKSLAALISTFPPVIAAVCRRVDLILPLLLA